MKTRERLLSRETFKICFYSAVFVYDFSRFKRTVEYGMDRCDIDIILCTNGLAGFCVDLVEVIFHYRSV